MRVRPRSVSWRADCENIRKRMGEVEVWGPANGHGNERPRSRDISLPVNLISMDQVVVAAFGTCDYPPGIFGIFNFNSLFLELDCLFMG